MIYILNNQTMAKSLLPSDSINEFDKHCKGLFSIDNEIAVEFVFNADYSEIDHIDVITSDNED